MKSSYPAKGWRGIWLPCGHLRVVPASWTDAEALREACRRCFAPSELVP